jgi:signal transduction histidine kinase
VLINLVSNAVKYNRRGGKIRIAAYWENEAITVTVSDTGGGIAPEHLKSLFEKFYRVPGSEHKATGSGLGLYICKRIVEAHNGNIRVHSKLGEGTTFMITLPVAL